MTRLFPEHYKRRVHSLNGAWRMIPDFSLEGEESGWQNGLPAGARTVMVPSVWNQELDLFHHFGVCWYEKEFTCDTERIMLEFGAVSGYTKVYLDGELLGDHYGGFSAFHFTACTQPGRHRLILMVDASSNENTIPQPYVDWYHYGGIIRDVEFSELPAVYIQNCHYEYTLSDQLDQAQLYAVVTLGAFEAAQVPLTIEIEGKAVAETVVSFSCAGVSTVRFEPIKLEKIRLWDVFAGNLYSVSAQTDRDDMYDRIGFRKIEATEQEIRLNGRPLFLKGVNRHEEHPDWGFAVPPQINKRDLDIIKGMNCNTIRGSHYPNSRSFLDMLDEEGILFWSEIPMWGFSKECMANPVIIERGLTMHKEMTEQYYNHPSIVFWGINNECDTTSQEGYDLCKLYADHLRENGGNRLITFADMYFEYDVCLKLVDFVSINKYHGWYGAGVDEWKKYIPWLRTRMKDAGVEEKPIVLSEYGAAGLYGYTSFDENKWTEEYQANLLKTVTELCYNEPGVVGTYVWQYCDIRSENELNRARSYNNKGILNEYRRPKLSYYIIKDLYGKLK